MAASWNNAIAVWRDEPARRFANEFWQPGQDALRRYRAAVEQLERALLAVEKLDSD